MQAALRIMMKSQRKISQLAHGHAHHSSKTAMHTEAHTWLDSFT